MSNTIYLNFQDLSLNTQEELIDKAIKNIKNDPLEMANITDICLREIREDIIKERFDRLLTKIQMHSDLNTKKYVGKTMDVLVEEINEHDNSLVTGRLSNNSIVHFKGDPSLIGQIVNVHLDEAKGFYYYGTIRD